VQSCTEGATSALVTTVLQLLKGLNDRMFIVEDIVRLDDRSLQRTLRGVPVRTIAFALKGKDDIVLSRLKDNATEHHAQDLDAEMTVLGSPPLSTVEDAEAKRIHHLCDRFVAGVLDIAGGDTRDC
jgi:flagellar motor switch protein FliG